MFKKKAKVKNRKKYSKGGDMAPTIGTLVGAGIGTAVAPGIGTSVGATLGGSLGTLIGQASENPDKGMDIDAAPRFVSPTYPTKGVDVPHFPMGGMIPYDYEVEGGEVIEGADTQLQGKSGKMLASNFQLVEGKSHEHGGVKGSGGERVFSDRSYVSDEVREQLSKVMKLPNKKLTHADLQKRIAKIFGDSEYNSAVGKDKLSQETAERNSKLAKYATEIVFRDQENQKVETNMKSPFKKKVSYSGGGNLPFATSEQLNQMSPEEASAAFSMILKTDPDYAMYIHGNRDKFRNFSDSLTKDFRRRALDKARFEIQKELSEPLPVTTPVAKPNTIKGPGWGNSGFIPFKKGGKLPKYSDGTADIPLLTPRSGYTEIPENPNSVSDPIIMPSGPSSTGSNINMEGVPEIAANLGSYLMNQRNINRIQTDRPVIQEKAPSINYTDMSGRIINSNNRMFRNSIAALERAGVNSASDIQRLHVANLNNNANALNQEVARRDSIAGQNAQLQAGSVARNVSAVNTELDDRLQNRVFKAVQSVNNRNALTQGVTAAIDNRNLAQGDRDKLIVLMRQFESSGVGGRFEDWLKVNHPDLYKRAYS